MNVPVDSDSEEYEAVDEEGEGGGEGKAGEEDTTDMPLD